MTVLSLPCSPKLRSFRGLNKGLKAAVGHEVVVQYATQVRFCLFLLAAASAAEESYDLLLETTETLQYFAFGQPPHIIIQNQFVVLSSHLRQQV